MDRAEAVAQALRAFKEQAYRDGQPDPDVELIAAKQAVDAAAKIIRDGRLGYALLGQLLHEVTYWHAWSKRENFKETMNFSCELIQADKETVKVTYGAEVTNTIVFVFSGRRYKIVHLDKGWSPAPDTSHKWGDVAFYAGEDLVMEVSAISEASDNHWKFETVKAFRVSDGVWMTDLLQMASDIERGWQVRRNKYREESARDAAKKIEL
jgi:hypothetical protein